MLKKLGLPIIAILLISSLLAPPIMSLINPDYSVAMMLSTEEEEKGNEKESEKKQDEKNLFVNSPLAAQNMFFKEKQANSIDCVFHLKEYKPDIIVPPPQPTA